jgi:hypothetical protein
VYQAGTMDKNNARLLGMRFIFSNQHHKSGTPLEAHFGLGKEKEVDIKVVLNNGKIIILENITADRIINIDLT